MIDLIPESQAVYEAETHLREYAERSNIDHIPRIMQVNLRSVRDGDDAPARTIRLDGAYATAELAEWMREHGWVFDQSKGPCGAWTYMGDRRVLFVSATAPAVAYEIGVMLRAVWELGRKGEQAPSVVTFETDQVRLWGAPMEDAADEPPGPLESADTLFGDDGGKR